MQNFPPVVQAALAKMDDQQRLTFESEYNRRKKSKGLMVFLAIVFPIQLILLGRPGLWFAYLFTGGGLGIWWIVEWFLTPGRVDRINGELATDIARDIKIMS